MIDSRPLDSMISRQAENTFGSLVSAFVNKANDSCRPIVKSLSASLCRERMFEMTEFRATSGSMVKHCDEYVMDQQRKLLSDLINAEAKVVIVEKYVRKARAVLCIPDGVSTKDWRIDQAYN